MIAFECQRTGCLFPEDYIESWGRNYGHGLGRHPVSEALINRYNGKPVADKYNEGQMSFPLAVCCAPVVRVEVTKDAFEKGKAILHKDDPRYLERAPLMREKSLKSIHGGLLKRSL